MRPPRPALAFLLLLSASIAYATSGVLVERVPRAIDKERALTIAESAMSRRGWTITAKDGDSIFGRYVDDNVESRIRIFMDRQTMRYEESATDLGAARRGASTDTKTPARWINRLISDIDSSIEEVKDERLVPADSRPPASERMAELRKLRDAGHITAEEFERKRLEILKDL